MPQQVINLGATGSGAGGDSARTAFEKAIANFAELYIAALPGTAAQKQAARDMFGLGTAATRAVQTGPTDDTAGALMGVGAFGWGNSTRDIGNGLITDQPTGAYYQVGVPENLFPAAGPMLNVKGNRSFVLYARASRAMIYTYGETPVLMKLFHDQNILGTVSQSGGVPTGAIIERGSNANGEYVRFADGTQICWLGNAPAEVGLRVGSVSAGATGTVIWGFPAAFASPPQVTADWGSNEGSIRVNGQPQRLSNRSTTQCPINWQALQSVGGAACQLDAVAIGRWYN